MLPDIFISELQVENLCTHFVLPWLRLSKLSFISFSNSFLTTDGKLVVVQVVDINLVFPRVMRHPQFAGLYKHDDYYYLSYKIPAEWHSDVQLFIKGKYSRLSKKAKETICKYSTLPYKQSTGTNTITDGRLLALDRDPVLKEMWERELSCHEHGIHSSVYIEDGAELLSIPDERSFIDLGEMVQIEV